jgi:hypothetical protein
MTDTELLNWLENASVSITYFQTLSMGEARSIHWQNRDRYLNVQSPVRNESLRETLVRAYEYNNEMSGGIL